MYIADSENNRIRKVTVFAGTISTIAGNGEYGYGGDGGLATAAEVGVVSGLAIDASGTTEPNYEPNMPLTSFCVLTRNL